MLISAFRDEDYPMLDAVRGGGALLRQVHKILRALEGGPV
jgi:hypothetical protein